MENYLKSVDERRGKTKGKVLTILREKGGKFAFVNPAGEWEEAPELRRIFEHSKNATGKYIEANEKEVADFIASKKAQPKAVKLEEKPSLKVYGAPVVEAVDPEKVTIPVVKLEDLKPEVEEVPGETPKEVEED